MICYLLLFLLVVRKNGVKIMEQYQFEFHQWQEAFEMFYRKRLGYKVEHNRKKLGKVSGNPRICLVISTALYSSGYWIEENAKADADTKVYRTVKAVKELEQRIKTKRESTVNVAIGLVL